MLTLTPYIGSFHLQGITDVYESEGNKIIDSKIKQLIRICRCITLASSDLSSLHQVFKGKTMHLNWFPGVTVKSSEPRKTFEV